MKIKKIILSSVVVILLGLVTNAIWDTLKPITTYLFKLTLGLSVLGFEKYKNNIYIEIAKGMHEGTSLQSFLTMNAFLLSFVLMLFPLLLMIRRRIALKEEGDKNVTFFDKMFTYQKDLPRKSWFLFLILFYVLFVGTIFTLDLAKQKYINGAVTNFEQLSKIIRPYISDEESLRNVSVFSQIKNKEDYINLVNKLQAIAKNNNQRIPEFSFTF